MNLAARLSEHQRVVEALHATKAELDLEIVALNQESTHHRELYEREAGAYKILQVRCGVSARTTRSHSTVEHARRDARCTRTMSAGARGSASRNSHG